MQRRRRFLVALCCAAAFIGGVAFVARAWTNPNAPPPGGTSAVATTSIVHGPKFVGIGTPNPAERLHVVGNFLQDNPSDPVVKYAGSVSGFPSSLAGKKIVFSGQYAYVLFNCTVSTDCLRVVDVTNPEQPQVVGGGSLSGFPASPTNNPLSIAVSGRYAYITFSGGGTNAFRVVDISNPVSPQVVGGSSLNLVSSLTDIFVSGRYAYITSSGGSSPIGERKGLIPVAHASSMAVNFLVMDIADPVNPVVVHTLSGLDPYTDVFVSQNYAYVVAPHFLGKIDISNPAAPGAVRTSPSFIETLTDVFVSGSYAYVTVGQELAILNVGVESPSMVSQTPIVSYGVEVFVAGRYAFLALNGDNHFAIVDVGNLASPAIRAEMLVGMAPVAITLSGRFAYLAGSLGSEPRMAIIDVSGVEAVSGNVGALQAGSLTVRRQGMIGGDLAVRGGFMANHAFFQGGVKINGSLRVRGIVDVSGTKPFVIDHPLDPAGKLLRHSAVEAPEMKTFYDGIIALDVKGEAVVTLPPYFEALNRNPRYQLKPVGQSMPNLYVKEEVRTNRFVIGGGAPDGTVSWQVTGVRKDRFAEQYPLVVEEAKGETSRKQE